MVAWIIGYGTEKINVRFEHVERAVDAACSSLTKEQAFNPRIKDNPAQHKEYDIHISVLRLLERVFAEGFSKVEEHQRKQIPRRRR